MKQGTIKVTNDQRFATNRLTIIGPPGSDQVDDTRPIPAGESRTYGTDTSVRLPPGDYQVTGRFSDEDVESSAKAPKAGAPQVFTPKPGHAPQAPALKSHVKPGMNAKALAAAQKLDRADAKNAAKNAAKNPASARLPGTEPADSDLTDSENDLETDLETAPAKTAGSKPASKMGEVHIVTVKDDEQSEISI